MNKNSVTQDIRRRYIEDNLECGQIINYTDLTAKDRLEIVLYEDLPNTEVKAPRNVLSSNALFWCSTHTIHALDHEASDSNLSSTVWASV